jgi:solute carrier family 5 (sodium-coupled monocarboxylate transporter), member 8/12
VDQIVPFTVMDFAIQIPGFPGLFIAGVFSAALRWMFAKIELKKRNKPIFSTMSTALNSLSGVILQEFIKPCLGERQLSEQAASNIMKLIVLIVGSFCTALIFFVDQLGGIIQVCHFFRISKCIYLLRFI